jgi:hypothetical protein
MQTALAARIGLLLSLAAGRVLAQILYEVSPTNPLATHERKFDARHGGASCLFLPGAPRHSRESDEGAANRIR